MITIKKRKISPIHTLTAPVLERLLVSVDEKTWQERGLQRAMAQASQMANSVPAYKTLLKEAGINSDSLVEVGFEYLPVIDKDNYCGDLEEKKRCMVGHWTGTAGLFLRLQDQLGSHFIFQELKNKIANMPKLLSCICAITSKFMNDEHCISWHFQWGHG
jgi:hypothetical protein